MEKQKSQSGFTLIELLIAVSILGILMTGLTSIYRTGIISSDSNENLINLQNEARVIKRMVENDVRSSTGDFDEIRMEDDTLVGFKIDNDIEYREANDNLVREEDDSEHVLTNNLENFDFTINENGLVSIDDITLRSDRGMEYAFSDRVYARRIGVALGGGSGGGSGNGNDGVSIYYYDDDNGEPNIWVWEANGGVEITEEMGYSYPGPNMKAEDDGWYVFDIPAKGENADGEEIDFLTGEDLKVRFNDGEELEIEPETAWYAGGEWHSGKPIQEMTVYYKTDWNNPNIHYSVNDDGWTVEPGHSMDDSEYDGYYVYTITDDYTTEDYIDKVKVAFNDGDEDWDNNDKDNYKLEDKTSTVKDREVSSGSP